MKHQVRGPLENLARQLSRGGWEGCATEGRLVRLCSLRSVLNFPIFLVTFLLKKSDKMNFLLLSVVLIAN
jgi:hypothetical protein